MTHTSLPRSRFLAFDITTSTTHMSMLVAALSVAVGLAGCGVLANAEDPASETASAPDAAPTADADAGKPSFDAGAPSTDAAANVDANEAGPAPLSWTWENPNFQGNDIRAIWGTMGTTCGSARRGRAARTGERSDGAAARSALRSRRARARSREAARWTSGRRGVDSGTSTARSGRRRRARPRARRTACGASVPAMSGRSTTAAAPATSTERRGRPGGAAALRATTGGGISHVFGSGARTWVIGSGGTILRAR